MNSRLLGISAIATAVLVVSVGIFIYNSASSTIADSMDTLSTQEIEVFNNQFASYEGEQTGSNVKALIGRLISNANIYIDEPSKVPQVYIDQLSEEDTESVEIIFLEDDAGDVTEYISALGKIRNKIETKHTYFIEITYQSNGIIDYIQISYNPENPIWEDMYR